MEGWSSAGLSGASTFSLIKTVPAKAYDGDELPFMASIKQGNGYAEGMLLSCVRPDGQKKLSSSLLDRL